MAIIITKLIESQDSEGIITRRYPDFAIVHETFCQDIDDETFVTIGLGGGTEITKAELTTRALAIHAKVPFQNIVYGTPPDPPNPPTVTDKTNAEVETMVDDWCAEKNVS